MSNETASPRPIRRGEVEGATLTAPEPEWRPHVDAWADPKRRAKVARGDCEGQEHLAAGVGLAGNILKFWLAVRLEGAGVAPELDTIARSILARHSAPRPHTIYGPNEQVVGTDTYVDSPMVVEGPGGRRYWLSLGPFYYRPGGMPSERPVKHPGPPPGEVAVVPVPATPTRLGGLPESFEVA